MEDLVDNNTRSMDEWGIKWEPIPEKVKTVMRTKSFGVGEEAKLNQLGHYDDFIRKADNNSDVKFISANEIK